MWALLLALLASASCYNVPSKTGLDAAFKAADAGDTGFVSYDILQDILSENDMELNDQVLITLMRRYDYAKDGNIKYLDLMALAGM